ncbi:class C sortase [Microbacterium enclense]|uniref:class C sortase n=1 Tax=Microbacterium enclense TaxID=993073 RepID=UPI003D73A7D7
MTRGFREGRRSSSASAWRMPWATAGLALMALGGVLLLLYPTISSWWSQYNQSRVVMAVESEVDGETDSSRAASLERARNYNSALVGGAILVAGSRAPQSSGAWTPSGEYDSLLRADADGAMARLRIPVIGVDLPIYHGTSDATLQKGVGHLEGTSLPVGGVDQHSVLTAHRGLAQATLFDHLDRVRVGDTFRIEVFGEVLTYRVRDTRVVLPDDTQTLSPQPGEDLMTLVTCTPVGINSHRILVTGERVTPTPPGDVARAGSAPDVPGFPWWALLLASAVVALIASVWTSGRRASSRAERDET